MGEVFKKSGRFGDAFSVNNNKPRDKLGVIGFLVVYILWQDNDSLGNGPFEELQIMVQVAKQVVITGETSCTRNGPTFFGVA